MPFLDCSYKTPSFFPKSGHFQTILASIGRKIPVPTYIEKHRINTPDGDFLELDFHKTNQTNENQIHISKNLVIISHGLEGNSHRAYILGMARAFRNAKRDVLCWNYRSCGSEMNHKRRFYHLGATDDLQTVIKYALSEGYESVDLIGFSAGGNLTLKYLGEQVTEITDKVKRAIVFSVPCDLSAGAIQMQKWQNRVYEHYFLRTLAKKVRLKALTIPDLCDLQPLNTIKHIQEFDEYYTAPLHGFKGAEDYYKKCSSLFFLNEIKTPTLIVNALNDPFLAPTCFPIELARKSEYVFLETPTEGGHCGFVSYGDLWWSEKRALEFIIT
jgi:uncharacterized protein